MILFAYVLAPSTNCLPIQVGLGYNYSLFQEGQLLLPLIRLMKAIINLPGRIQ